MKEAHHIINLHVDDEPGVLTRVTGLIRREGWNITDLTVAGTVIPKVSRLTIGVFCRTAFLQHIIERLGKLTCVLDIGLCDPEECRELGVVSVHNLKDEDRGAVQELVDKFGARLLLDSDSEIRYEITGSLGIVDRFLEALEPFGKLRVARSGAVALVKREH